MISCFKKITPYRWCWLTCNHKIPQTQACASICWCLCNNYYTNRWFHDCTLNNIDSTITVYRLSMVSSKSRALFDHPFLNRNLPRLHQTLSHMISITLWWVGAVAITITTAAIITLIITSCGIPRGPTRILTVGGWPGGYRHSFMAMEIVFLFMLTTTGNFATDTNT